MPAQRRRVLLLLAGFGAALLTVALAEGVLHLFGFGGHPGDFYFARLGERLLEPQMFARHPRRFFALQPGYRHSAVHAGPNALGDRPFRGPPLDRAPEELWRIAVFGDSCVYGLPLPANQSLPARLEGELAQELGEGRALVANLGVPGYSTVQIRALVDEVLACHALDEVVLYPAAWNDQAPSLGGNDLELSAKGSGLAGILQRSALAGALRAARTEGEAVPGEARERGPRVPEESVEDEVRKAIRACRAAGAGVTVVVPAHPEPFRATHARMFRDADAVRRAALAEGADMVDLQAVLGAPEQRERYFADLVHPAPEGHRTLARAVAEVLLRRVPARVRAVEPAGGALRIAVIEPRAVPELGDAVLELELEGWSRGEPLPAITVGGTSLLDVTPSGEHALRGVVPRLAPGAVRAVVQTEAGLALASLDVLAPRLAVLPGELPRVRATSRPGDGARVYVATALSPEPRWSARGAQRLDEAACLPLEVALALGADGAGEAPLPPLQGPGPFYLQALILPPGEPPDSSFAVWSEVATWP